MRAFHIDLNHANPTGDRLRRWLGELAAMGYDTILWEAENAVRWDTCPSCATPDAFTKAEFRAILDHARSLGLAAIPLFQTLGHCEYVLKDPAYMHLAELPGRIEQYCPNHPELLPFLQRWIAEHLELFGDIRRFHVGMDEAILFGRCPACRAEAAANGLHGLFDRHLRAVIAPLLARGITPMIWADMALAHLETIDRLPREVELCDWNYFSWQGQDKAWLWSRRHPETLHNEMVDPGTLTADELRRFGPDLWPQGRQAPIDPTYTAHHLARQGFAVVACPTTSCYGDNVFASRFRDKLQNTVTWVRSGARSDLRGSIVTSWTVHQHPWELQLHGIECGALALRHPGDNLDVLLDRHVAARFGCPTAPPGAGLGTALRALLPDPVHHPRLQQAYPAHRPARDAAPARRLRCRRPVGGRDRQGRVAPAGLPRGARADRPGGALRQHGGRPARLVGPGGAQPRQPRRLRACAAALARGRGTRPPGRGAARRTAPPAPGDRPRLPPAGQQALPAGAAARLALWNHRCGPGAGPERMRKPVGNRQG